MSIRTLGDVIRQLRQERAWTQAELGTKIGTDATNVGRIERGLQNMSLARLEAIAQAFNTNPAGLFRLAEDVNEPAQCQLVPVVGETRWVAWNKGDDTTIPADGDRSHRSASGTSYSLRTIRTPFP